MKEFSQTERNREYCFVASKLGGKNPTEFPKLNMKKVTKRNILNTN